MRITSKTCLIAARVGALICLAFAWLLPGFCLAFACYGRLVAGMLHRTVQRRAE